MNIGLSNISSYQKNLKAKARTNTRNSVIRKRKDRGQGQVVLDLDLERSRQAHNMGYRVDEWRRRTGAGNT